MVKEKNFYYLIMSRVINNTGDWFYYFVITLFIYTINNSPVYMSILTIAYILPGVILGNKIERIFYKYNIKNIVIISDFIRAILILIMSFSNNIFIILLLVFLEQMFSIVSNIKYQEVIVNELDDSNLTKFNSLLNTMSNLMRVVVVPIFLLSKETIGIRGILRVNFILTIISIIIFFMIKLKKNIKNNVNSKNEDVSSIIENNKKILFLIYILIYTFGILSIIRIGIESYGITYLGENGVDVSGEYSIFSVVTSLALIISSYLSCKVIERIKNNYKLIVCFAIFSTPFLTYISFNIKCSFIMYICIFLVMFIINMFELYILSIIQIRLKGVIDKILSFQIRIYNMIALANSMLGGVIVDKMGARFYYNLSSTIVLILGIIIIFLITDRRKKNV